MTILLCGMVENAQLVGAAYLAPEGFEAELRHELGDAVTAAHDRLLLTSAPARAVAWTANVWLGPRWITFGSISEGAKALRAMQRNWALYPCRHHRRAALIAEKLPHVSARPLRFPEPAPAAPLGSWTLVEPNLMLASPRCSSPFPNGVVRFVEDKDGPPNRAYLKLWEALTAIGRYPRAGERCLDLGASPGGWSWALARLGAQVISVDKAPLDPAVAAMPGVEFRQASAFALPPQEIGRVDWLLSDVVCYPGRLYRLVETWMGSGRVGNFVCTIKFQGETDFAAMRLFAAVPGSRLMHLHHNKHELTWVRLAFSEL
jgi:23S rRNA (cytidine2498-2'-O)-methyltransferase